MVFFFFFHSLLQVDQLLKVCFFTQAWNFKPISKAVCKFSSELMDEPKMACFILMRMTNINTLELTERPSTLLQILKKKFQWLLIFGLQYGNNFHLYMPSNSCRFEYYLNVSFFRYTFRPGIHVIILHVELSGQFLFWSNVNFEC